MLVKSGTLAEWPVQVKLTVLLEDWVYGLEGENNELIKRIMQEKMENGGDL